MLPYFGRNNLFALVALLGIKNFTSYALVAPPISVNEGRDVEACISACQAVRTSLFKFCKDMNKDTWEPVKNDFTTCQYRCYKCTMVGAIDAIDYIDGLSSDFADEQIRQTILAFHQLDIITSLQDCKNSWKLVASLNCTKIPVESAVNFFTEKCVG